MGDVSKWVDERDREREGERGFGADWGQAMSRG